MHRAPLLPLLAGALISSSAFAQQADIPLANWTVPPYQSSSAGGYSTMVDATPPRAFIGLQVCRLLDTRPPANNPLDGDGAYGTDTIRTYDLDAKCGLPTGVDAVSLNFTVTNTVSNPFGHLKAWPANQAEPNVSTLNWNTGGQTVANAAIVPLSPTGTLSVKSGNAGSDVIIDVNGYFSDVLGTPANSFTVENNSDGFTAFFSNLSTTCSEACGLFAVTNSGHAIYGLAEGGNGDGVSGATNGSGRAGVRGQASTASGWGGLFTNGSGVGARGDSPFQGVQGRATSVANNTAGVQGSNGGGEVSGSFTTAGVRGESAGVSFGVLGLASAGTGTGGFRVQPGTGTVQSGAELGFSPTVGLVVYGDSQSTGTKSSIEPHPSDASKMIRHISLEGNEAGTYFRGRGRFQNGIAVIEVPEDFRLVTDPEGLTVQITPIGGMATVGVLRMGLDKIVAQSSRDLEFSYLVQGVRHAYKHFGPIAENEKTFVPESPDEPMPAYLPEVLKQRLISNGTYTAAGKVNMETAKRLGWDKIWEQRSRPAPQPAEPLASD